MSAQEPCIETAVLIAYASGELPENALEPLEAHLAECPDCRAALAGLRQVAAPRVLEEIASSPGRSVPAEPVLRRLAQERRIPVKTVSRARGAYWAAAAAVLLVLGAAGIAWGPHGEPKTLVPQPRPAGRPVSGTAEAWTDPAGPGERVLLPEGTVIGVGPGTRAHFLPSAEGARYHLHVDEGTVEADVAKASAGAFRITADAGEVRVLGTRLTVSAFSLSGEKMIEGGPASAVLCVEVTEGTALLRNAQGQVLLAASSRGLSLPGGPPGRQELISSPDRLLAGFAQTLEWKEGRWTFKPGGADGGLTAAAAFWGCHKPAGWNWAEGWSSHPPELRAAAVLLAGLRMPGGAAEELRRLAAAETDPRARAAIAQAQTRLPILAGKGD